MTSINSVSPTRISTSWRYSNLSKATIKRLLELGIDPTTVTSEAKAQYLIEQAEAAKKTIVKSEDEGDEPKKKFKAEQIQQNIYNNMDMISVSNKLILGLTTLEVTKKQKNI